MKKIIAFIAIALIAVMCGISVSGETVVSDVFGADTVLYDVNIDGELDILDLIRLKRYAAGEKVQVNLNITGKSGDTLSNALVEIKKELLGVNG